jgi:hypothetical protein
MPKLLGVTSKKNELQGSLISYEGIDGRLLEGAKYLLVLQSCLYSEDG